MSGGRPRLPGSLRRPSGYTPEDAERGVHDDQMRYLVEGLSMTRYGQPVTEERTSHARVGLGAGDHGGFTLEKENGYVRGLSAATRVTRKVTIREDSVLSDLEFYGSTGELLLITNGATVMVRNSIFRKTDGTKVHIVVESGCKLVLTGCMFFGGSGAGYVIDNQATVYDVLMDGCYNATGNAISATDSVYEMGTNHGTMTGARVQNGGWKDILADISAGRGIGATAPTWSTFRGAIDAYAFSVADEVWVNVHVPHDVHLGGELIYPHVHWSGNTANTGKVKWQLNYTYARGYQQEDFPAPVTIEVEQDYAGQYYHHIAEPTEGNGIDPASLPATATTALETDALFLVNVARVAASASEFPDPAFAFFVDFHYLSDGENTRERNASFTKRK